MNKKLSLFDAEMQSIGRCCECSQLGGNIRADCFLRNLISERLQAPRYGGIPHMFTDWARRLNARIAVIAQDWGADIEALALRDYYEKRVETEDGTPEDIWAELIRNRPEIQNRRELKGPSRTDTNLKKFLEKSALLEGLHLPPHFMDSIFMTNAILCFRNGSLSSGQNNIDLTRSIANCCSKRKFLRNLLEIVNPVVVVTLGQYALKGVHHSNTTLRSLLKKTRRESEHGYIISDYDGLSLRIVPVYHPSARLVNRNCEEQVADYSFVWKSLSARLGLVGDELVRACFPVSE